MEIVLYSDDISLINKWENAIGNNCKICYEFDELKNIKNSIIVINYTAFEDDIKESIKFFNSNENRLLVFEKNPTLRNAKKILKLGAKGYGNIEIKEHFILSAIETIKDGMVWLHSEFTTMLLNDTSSKKQKEDVDIDNLTKREKEVINFLKDGISYKDIAQKLSITPRTVKAHAQNIYTKLNVKDRLSLSLLFK
ncbi:MAG: response regulator transcription factor [Campylobacterales bacterium]